MKTITREFLASGKTKLDRACENQLKIFSAQWPEGMPVTAKNIITAYKKLDVDWFVDHKLPARSRAAYLAAEAPAWAAYLAAQAPSRKAYLAEIAPVLAEIILNMEEP